MKLTLPEWAVGQLTNIYYIKDPGMVKKVLLQTILALKDTTSLPWQAVRAGNLSMWSDLTLGPSFKVKQE